MKVSVSVLRHTGASCADFAITLLTLAALNALFIVGAAAIITDAFSH